MPATTTSRTSTTTKLSSPTEAATMKVVASGLAPNETRARRLRRRLSTTSSSPTPSLKVCRSLSHPLETLDLSSASPAQTLASLRFLVLSYLADLERRLSELESPTFETWKSQRESTIEEATQCVRTALDMLEGIRADVCSHLPEIHFTDLSSVELFVKSHLPDMPEVPNLSEMRSHLPDIPQLPDMTDVRSHLPDMTEMRSHFPDMPHLPDMDDVRSHLSDMRLKFDDVRTCLHDLDFQQPLSYIPTLSDNLNHLHSHLSSMELPSGEPMSSVAPSAMLSDLLDALLNSETVSDILNSTPDVIVESEVMLERAASEVMNAVRKSLEGVHLIKYSDLPEAWKNNPFVTHGYRFIPIERWPLLIMSLFAFHNETLNIHTHLIPFLLWFINLVPLFNSTSNSDTPEILFMAFALLCLFSSAVWHTMSGCADRRSMELCARLDYIGIGWLISASVGTVVHYGFQCHPHIGEGFLGLCLATGIAGNVLPFMAWFNQHKYRYYRIIFFVSMAFSSMAPLIALSLVHSRKEMLEFMAPVFPSLISYVIGLIFYALHFPERALPESINRRLDMIGGGSHAIWHCFIVLAVSQHKAAISSMKEGMQCGVAGYS